MYTPIPFIRKRIRGEPIQYSFDSITDSHASPETVLLLRAVQPFETFYLTRSADRLNTAVATAFAGGMRLPPGASEGLTAGRAMANELDSARFDPLLVKSIAKNVSRATDVFTARVDDMVRLFSACEIHPPN